MPGLGVPSVTFGRGGSQRSADDGGEACRDVHGEERQEERASPGEGVVESVAARNAHHERESLSLAASASDCAICGRSVLSVSAAGGAGTLSTCCAHRGSHQFHRPNWATSAGTSMARTTVASSRIPAPSAVAMTLTSVSGAGRGSRADPGQD
jgi:hypothetical protein